jgi:hypothetical protein
MTNYYSAWENVNVIEMCQILVELRVTLNCLVQQRAYDTVLTCNTCIRHSSNLQHVHLTVVLKHVWHWYVKQRTR